MGARLGRILFMWIRPLRHCWKLLAWIWIVILFGVGVNVGSSWLITKHALWDLHNTPLGWFLEHPMITFPFAGAFLLLTGLSRLASRQAAKQDNKQGAHALSQRSAQNYKDMLALLDWMYQDLLTNSLQEIVSIKLDFVEQPRVIQNATNLILRQTKQAERFLPPGTSILQVYQEANRELLILGPLGAGKSVLLYQLGHDLVANHQPEEPLPIVFPLASWSEKKLPLADWMEEHLASPMYHVPQKQAQQWMQDESVLPLLDGLDEVEEPARPACIAAINTYRRNHPLCPLVVCSRSTEYAHASERERLQLQSAIEVQLLSPAQLNSVLAQVENPASALCAELETNPELRELVRTPLWLNLSLLALKNIAVSTLPKQRSALQQQICTLYVQHVVELKGDRDRYSLEKTTRWLSWLAIHMQERNQRLLAVEQFQPAVLAKEPLTWYRRAVVLILGLLFGLGVGLSVALSFGLPAGLFFGLGVGYLWGWGWKWFLAGLPGQDSGQQMRYILRMSSPGLGKRYQEHCSTYLWWESALGCSTGCSRDSSMGEPLG